MAETVIRSRIDADVKQEAQQLLDKLGLSMSEAIRLFLHQVVIEKGLPFPVKLASDAAREHDRWFCAQVEESLAVANDPAATFVAHEQVRADWKRKRKTLSTPLKPEAKA